MLRVQTALSQTQLTNRDSPEIADWVNSLRGDIIAFHVVEVTNVIQVDLKVILNCPEAGNRYILPSSSPCPHFPTKYFPLTSPQSLQMQLTWNCHPTSISQTNHKHPIAHLSDRWSTGLQVHQSCWKLWPCGTCIPVSCGNRGQSQLSEEQVSSELLHSTFLQNHVWLTYSTVWCLNWHLRRGASELNIWH